MLAEMNVADIYFSTTGFLLHLIYIRRCRNNSQQYMLANNDYKKIQLVTKNEKYCQHLCYHYVYMSPVH